MKVPIYVQKLHEQVIQQLSSQNETQHGRDTKITHPRVKCHEIKYVRLVFTDG